MLGQHGDYATPVWSQLQVRGVAASEMTALVQRIRAGGTLADFPNEVRTHKARMLDLVHSGQVHDAYALVQSLPPDLRAAVKPFFTHFTAGRTTEIVTAYAVAEIVAALVAGEQRALPAQVLLDGEWLGLHAVIAAPVILALDGWEHVYPLELNAEEVTSLAMAMDAIAAANAAVTT
jgi:malate dehydrogenase